MHDFDFTDKDDLIGVARVADEDMRVFNAGTGDGVLELTLDLVDVEGQPIKGQDGDFTQLDVELSIIDTQSSEVVVGQHMSYVSDPRRPAYHIPPRDLPPPPGVHVLPTVAQHAGPDTVGLTEITGLAAKPCNQSGHRG